ncbi:MAG TPA: DUF1643 domain-containing protein [Telluria sp.]|jgi:hypothetical protein
MTGQAVLSRCGRYRYRLERQVQAQGLVFAYFGVNGATATAQEDDHTVRKWLGFTERNGGSRFIVGNAFALRATDVRELGRADDPVGPRTKSHLAKMMAEADVLVPCWGSRAKLPQRLHGQLDTLREQIFRAGKPVRVWGLSLSGDPLHPLTLPYSLPLVEWLR